MRKIAPKMMLLIIFAILLVTVFPAAAETVTTINTINFDYLNGRLIPSGMPITNQYESLGVTFSGSLTAIARWNDVYPVYSPPNYAAIQSNQIVVTFASPVSNVGLLYTNNGNNPVIVSAYNSNGQMIGQVSGGRNSYSIGHLAIDQPSISSIVVVGPQNFFTIDDLSFTSTSTTPTTPTPPDTPASSIPEFPSMAIPVAGIIGLLFVFGHNKRGI